MEKREYLYIILPWIVIFALVIGVGSRCARVGAQQWKRADISEQAFCDKAGYVSAVWDGGSNYTPAQFYCVEKDGQLVRFLAPECNKRNLDNCRNER